MLLNNLSKTKKETIVDALESCGFKVYKKKEEITAVKGEHIVTISSLGEVDNHVNFQKFFSKINYVNDINGFPQLELKKLIKEEKRENKSLFESFLHVINKLNWSQKIYNEIMLEDQSVKFVEFFDEEDNLFTFIFLQDEDNETMYMTTLSSLLLYKEIDKVLEVTAFDLCPKLENLLD